VDPFPPELLHHQRRTALVGAALFLLSAFPDLAQDGPVRFIAFALAARVAWAACLVAGAALLAASPPRLRLAATVIVAGSTVSAVALVATTGAEHGGYFPLLQGLPLAIAVLLPGNVLAAALSGLAGTTAATLLLGAGDAPAIEILRAALAGFMFTGLAAYGTHVVGELFRTELAAARARADTLAALAESERRLAQSSRLAVVGRLAAGVAHEINNPLGYVKASLAFVREHLQHGMPEEDRAEVGEALADAVLGVERIRRIVADLGGFARPDDGDACASSTPEAIDEARRLASIRTGSAAIRVTVDPDAPAVRMCRRRLVQVLVNILVNAGDAMEEAGLDAARRWIEVEALREDERLLIRVEDGGRGIRAEDLPHLFEPFFTTKPPGLGTGLGLALSHEYVAAVGGQLSARNGERGGAVFEVRLPVTPGPLGCTSCRRAAPSNPAARLAG
jgi:signal transduction histidine kinase